MLKSKYFIVVLGVILFLTGIIGVFYERSQINFGSSGDVFYNGSGMMNSFNWSNRNTGSMMGYGSSRSYDENDVKLTLEELEEHVEKYISNFNTELEISDIFVYEDSEYYFSIIETDTERGAMELLVNPYTGNIFPEYGPNMMWNLKYGMHGSGGMMSGRGMMGYNNYDLSASDYEENKYTSEEAYDFGVKYLDKVNDEFELSDDYHEFYGYFTFHVDKDGQTIGMMSINGFTGDVWYHDWHGELIEIINRHEDSH